jgi:hypothetical protein
MSTQVQPSDGMATNASIVAPVNATSNTTDITLEDHALATRLATETGKLLADLRATMVADGVEPKEMKDAGDLAAHRFIWRP